jgi:hypothetical protein
MKDYKVHWSDRHKEKSTISANSEEEAAKLFFESQKEQRDQYIWVSSGLGIGPRSFLPEEIGLRKLGDHIEKQEEVEPSGPDGASEGVDSVQVNFDLVERRSAWSVLQFLCGVICIIAGCVFLSDNEEITGIAFIAIGVQAFFIGFLINVFTDIRWFLQESLKIQRKRKR